MTAPDQDIAPVWDKMTDSERQWYNLFRRATLNGDRRALRELCDLAPKADYERIKREIDYEKAAGRRRQNNPRPERKATYSEFDYWWEPEVMDKQSGEAVKNIIIYELIDDRKY